MATADELAALRAELIALRGEVDRLRREPATARNAATHLTTRRNLFRAAGLIGVASLATAVGPSGNARAATGNALTLGVSSAGGGSPNTAESATEVRYDGPATAPSTLFLVNDTSYTADQPRYYNSVLAGWAGAHQSLNVGLYGYSEVANNPIGLVGRGDNLSPDNPQGIGVEGSGVTGVHGVGTQYGIHAEGGQAPLLLEPGPAAGPPMTGVSATGALYIDADGGLYVCKAAGNPGLWVRVGFTGLVPTRVYDSRLTGGPIQGNAPRRIPIAGLAGVPPIPGAGSVAIAITVISPTANGYLTVYPSGTNKPLVSNYNYTVNQVGNAFTLVKLGADGAILAAVLSGAVQLAVDVMGYFS